jgi:environmental stress-induced protein Ves
LKVSILSPQHFTTSQWSGGTTTQLYIFPANASYSERNFELRISTAKVEVAESTFTALPGFQRKLMILEGEIFITHEGHYSKRLQPFEVEHFSGDWKTSAIGTCTDFNVMTTGLKQSEVYFFAMGATMDCKLKPKTACNGLFLYATSGSIQLQLLNQTYTLKAGNLMVVENFDIATIAIRSAGDFGLVVVEMA